MRWNCILALGLAGVLAAGTVFAAGTPASPIRLKVIFGGAETEMMMEPGETARLRNHRTGEIVYLRAIPQPGKLATARVEVSRMQGTVPASSGELVEMAVGERAQIRTAASQMELELLEVPAQELTAASQPNRFEVTLELPGGRTIMGASDARPDEIMRVRDRRTGLFLGFRPALSREGQSTEVEVFSIIQKAQGGEDFRFLTRVPVGGQFTLRGDRLGLASDGGTPVKIRGRVSVPDPAMWEGLARAGGSDEPVSLKARWAGSPSWVDGVAYDGEMFRLAVPGVEGEIGLAPAPSTRLDADTRKISVFQIRKVPGEGEALKLIDTMQVREGEPVQVPGFDGNLELQTFPRRTIQQKGICWASCEGVRVCGCGASCGDVDCCFGRCCLY
jgi:hypothetical protein